MTLTSRKCITSTFLKIFVATAAIAAALAPSHALAQEPIAASPVFTAGAASFSSNAVSFRASTEPILFAELTPAPPITSNSTGEALPEAPLPEDPGQVLVGSNVPGDTHPAPPAAHVAPITLKYIPAGWTAQPLTAHDKVVIGFRDSYSPFSFLGIIASAGYSHLVNGQPNYGTNSKAFGKRVGATAIRDTSEQLFTDVVFAPMLHEDPRYYVEGDQYNFFHRAIYAATRPIVTRTDSGHATPNIALLLGYGAGSAISYSYYPAINQNAKDTFATFGGSLAGAAIGDLVSEFSDEVLIKLHLKKAL
jgi:hypothetical protein